MARSVLGDRTIEAELDAQTGITELYLVMRVVKEPTGIDEIGIDQTRAHDLEVDDELLIPLYYLPRDKHQADDLKQSVLFHLSALPVDAFQAMQGALKLQS